MHKVESSESSGPQGITYIVHFIMCISASTILLLAACMLGLQEKLHSKKMETKFTSKTGRKNVFVPAASNGYHCYISKSTNNLRLTCNGCRTQFLVPPSTNIYHCLECETVNVLISGSGQSTEDSAIHSLMQKDGAKSFKHDRSESANKKANFTGNRSYPAVDSSLSLSRRGNKRAVLCGVTYRERKFRLKGAINDVKNMKELLTKVFKFPNECIRILTEQDQNPELIPTKKNILESLKWLVKDCQPGDSLVFYFSGHGLQQPDLVEDEMDGFDETICPVDFMREGMIVDNDINSMIVQPLKEGVTLHAIVDACHSGTILDLAYVYNKENRTWEENKPPAKVPIRKHTSGGLAICFSACEDSQIAVDTSAFGGKGMNGLMTYIFTKIIKENPAITYGGLMQKIHEGIDRIVHGKRRHSFLKHVFRRRVTQDPILSSSQKFDIFQKVFTL